MQFEAFGICDGFLRDLKLQSKNHASAEADLRRFLDVLRSTKDWFPLGANYTTLQGYEMWKFRIGITSRKIGKSNGFRLLVGVRDEKLWLVFLYTHKEYESQPPISEILKRLPK